MTSTLSAIAPITPMLWVTRTMEVPKVSRTRSISSTTCFCTDTSRAEFRTRARELLQRLGFENGQRILDAYPFELSGGLQQRVGIAAAMLLSPSVLLADEPTSALDVSVQKQVVEEMLLVRRTFGTSVVLVTHNIGVIGAMADKVLVMKNGEMVEYGDTEQVLNDPKEAYTRTLMSAVPRLKR